MPHEVGSIIEGKVTGITKFGAFVELDDGAVGMVHISEISQSYVNDISEHLKENQIVKVKVLNVGDDGKISLSIKRALPQQGGFRRDNNRRKLLFFDFRFNQIRLAFPLDGKRHGVVLAVFQKTDRIVEV